MSTTVNSLIQVSHPIVKPTLHHRDIDVLTCVTGARFGLLKRASAEQLRSTVYTSINERKTKRANSFGE
jgi:hypothetical protein